MDHRILIVDDNAAIHDDFKKILSANSNESEASLQDARNAFFGEAKEIDESPGYRLDSAFQGEEALKMVVAANEEGDPYSMAFVDVRMPPGWDGVQTIVELWKVAPDLECVICTAFSDYTWSDMAKTLGQSDKLLILKKPFDPVEARQFASTLTTKWQTFREQARINQALSQAESQAKSYAASLETVNQALRTSKASADNAAQMRGEFLHHLSVQVQRDLSQVMRAADLAPNLDSDLADSLKAGETLLNTVAGVLDFTDIENGTYVTKSSQVQLGDTLRETLAPFEARAKETQVQLAVDIAPGIDTQYVLDSEGVQKLVSLLVDNSLRHGSPGDIQVKAWVQRSGNWAKPSLCVQVSDTGPGLPSEYEGQMYEPLTRLSEGTRFGIGLALAKQLVQVMGGDLKHSAVEPSGSCFLFEVHLTEAGANSKAA